MKKLLLIFTAILLVSAVVLAACESESGESASSDIASDVSDTSSVVSESSTDKIDTSSKDNKEETTQPQPLVQPTPVGPDTEPVGSPLSVIGCSFSEKPYFVLIGKCALNAEVTGEANSEKVTSKSYNGLFSVRLRCDGTSVKVKLFQTVNGAQVGDVVEYTASPVTPGWGKWPVIAGKDLQFFLQKMLPDFQGTNIPTTAVLNSLTTRVSNRLTQLQKNNPDAEIIYLLVPSAITIYPELVPSQYNQAVGQTRLDLVSEALTKGGATVIDLKTLFTEHKNDEKPLYLKLDSHWTEYGAFLAYTELFNHISTKFPEAKPHDISQFNWKGDYYKGGDMTNYLELSAYNIQEYSYYRTFNIPIPKSIADVPRYVSNDSLTYSDDVTATKALLTGNENLPSCFVIRDSYSTQMYDILAERMNKTYYSGMWNYVWDNTKLNTLKPDYVIYIIAEWNIQDAIINK